MHSQLWRNYLARHGEQLKMPVVPIIKSELSLVDFIFSIILGMTILSEWLVFVAPMPMTSILTGKIKGLESSWISFSAIYQFPTSSNGT